MHDCHAQVPVSKDSMRPAGTVHPKAGRGQLSSEPNCAHKHPARPASTLRGPSGRPARPRGTPRRARPRPAARPRASACPPAASPTPRPPAESDSASQPSFSQHQRRPWAARRKVDRAGAKQRITACMQEQASTPVISPEMQRDKKLKGTPCGEMPDARRRATPPMAHSRRVWPAATPAAGGCCWLQDCAMQEEAAWGTGQQL